MAVLIGLAVGGSVVLMTGEFLGFVTGVLGMPAPGGLPHPVLIAVVFVVAGLFCGAVIVTMAIPGSEQPMRRAVLAVAHPRFHQPRE